MGLAVKSENKILTTPNNWFSLEQNERTIHIDSYRVFSVSLLFT